MRRRLLLVLCLALAGCREPPPESLSVAEQLGGRAADAFLRAEAPRTFRFPEDHGPHAGFRNEWWYLTGNLDGAGGRRFGYQATFFRIGLDPTPGRRASPWATSEVWMAHLALSDAASATHRGSERFARGAAGLAGATTDPLRIWLEDWQLASDDGGATWRLRVASDDFALDLGLRPARPAVLQGEAGLSRKSAAPGNASYYYSLPRLETHGSLTLEGTRHEVRGLSWLDREWSTSALDEGQVGWDWLALQLADGRDLMYYRLRRGDGTVDPMSRGSLVDGEGRRVELGPDLDLRPVRHWTAPDGRRYPVEWALRLPGDARPLRVAAVFDAQQMALAVRYWEGMVDVRDAADGTARGRGYLELTGY